MSPSPAFPSSKGTMTSPSWWVRLCCLFWYALRYVWSALFAGIVISAIANLTTTTTDTPLSKLYLVHLVATYPLLAGAVFVLLLSFTGISWIGQRERHRATPLSLSQQNRLHMLQRLRCIYNDLLAQSLQGMVWLELGLASNLDAVENTSTLLLHMPKQPERLLPAGTSIVEVYEQANHELLILGDAGTGKSTLLLHLAQHLVKQAEQDATHLLPVILPLSTWMVKRPALDIWLVEQLIQTYRVPRSQAWQLVRDEQILPLLDGLDEMEEQARPTCIAAINAYHRDHLLPLVVCSRRSEYEAATTGEQLTLQNAVVVQALTPAQVDDYVLQAGEPLDALRWALGKNPTLKDLANTPLMLHILVLTYQGAEVRQLPQGDAPLRQQVWTDYVRHMIEHKKDVQHYSPHQIVMWLGWLARQMRNHNQTIFYLEQLQPDWLPSRQCFFYRYSAMFLIGLLIVLFVELTWMLAIGLPVFLTRVLSGLPPNNLVQGFLGGLLGTLPLGLLEGFVFGAFIGKHVIKPSEEMTWSDMRFRLIAGLSIVLSGGAILFWLRRLRMRISGKQLTERLSLSPNEGIRRSAKNGLLIGLLGGPIGGLFIGSFAGLGAPSSIKLVFGLVEWLFYALQIGGLMGLLFGLGAVIQHYTLRIFLWRTRTFPWKAQRFLDDAVVCIFLRRVGGGYSFVHRLLQDYFADLHA